jgi:hypothetical protein
MTYRIIQDNKQEHFQKNPMIMIMIIKEASINSKDSESWGKMVDC